VISTELINGDSVFIKLAREWDGLASGGMTDTPFQQLAYQRAWWKHLQPSNGTLHTIVARDDNKLVAIACLYLIDGVLYFNGCVEETDYLDLIVTTEYAEPAWQAVFDVLCNANVLDWSGLDLCNVPDASPTRSILAAMAPARGLTFSQEIHEVCPVIELPATFEEYLNGLPKKQRHEIRRKLRRAAAAGVSVTLVGADDDVTEAVDDFLVLLQKSTLEKRDWLNEGRRAVFHEVARAAQAAGSLQLMFVELNNQKVAALFNFGYRDRIWVYNSGLDPASFSNLSLGVVATAKAIEMAIEESYSTFDFLRGSETYKYRFGAEDTSIYRICLSRQA
jgi:CelD/BcsL family acetyltransferase involved in cellulose biosynthesis